MLSRQPEQAIMGGCARVPWHCNARRSLQPQVCGDGQTCCMTVMLGGE